MPKSQKLQWIVFLGVFILIVLEIFYAFFYRPPISKKMLSGVLVPTVVVKTNNVAGTPFNFDEKSASQSGSQVEKIILEAKKKKLNFISYGYFLKALMIGNKNCPTIKNCFESSNTAEKEWKSHLDKDFPIGITGPFVVRLNFYGSKGPSGINLNGRVSSNNTIWWQGIKSIFFGIGSSGKELYIDAKSSGPDPFFLYRKTFDKKIEGIYALFNVKGTSILVTDLSFNKITYIDINKVTNNKFPEGLFPDKQFYISYSIAPLSDLVIYDFSVL